MRLLNTKTLVLEDYTSRPLPPYAILSHRWGDEEVTFSEIQSDRGKAKNGYRKIRGSCAAAIQYKDDRKGVVGRGDSIDHVWIDTCCINKESSNELAKAIKSMLRWYQQASICFAYLSDVTSAQDILKSEWYDRGWTLQELLAPRQVIFFDQDWQQIGTRTQLIKEISHRTGIRELLLSYSQTVGEASIAEKMSWAASRQVTKPEDTAYCLLGLFDVQMTPKYGEGGAKAFFRLQRKLLKESNDLTWLAWEFPPQLLASSKPTSLKPVLSAQRSQGIPVGFGVLAPSPAFFKMSGSFKYDAYNCGGHDITTGGATIQATLNVITKNNQLYIFLPCVLGDNQFCSVGVPVIEHRGRLFRLSEKRLTMLNRHVNAPQAWMTKLSTTCLEAPYSRLEHFSSHARVQLVVDGPLATQGPLQVTQVYPRFMHYFQRSVDVGKEWIELSVVLEGPEHLFPRTLVRFTHACQPGRVEGDGEEVDLALQLFAEPSLLSSFLRTGRGPNGNSGLQSLGDFLGIILPAAYAPFPSWMEYVSSVPPENIRTMLKAVHNSLSLPNIRFPDIVPRRHRVTADYQTLSCLLAQVPKDVKELGTVYFDNLDWKNCIELPNCRALLKARFESCDNIDLSGHDQEFMVGSVYRVILETTDTPSWNALILRVSFLYICNLVAYQLGLASLFALFSCTGADQLGVRLLICIVLALFNLVADRLLQRVMHITSDWISARRYRLSLFCHPGYGLSPVPPRVPLGADISSGTYSLSAGDHGTNFYGVPPHGRGAWSGKNADHRELRCRDHLHYARACGHHRPRNDPRSK